MYKNRDWLYHRYILEGQTCKQIAETVNCHPRTIHSWLTKHNISRRKGGFNSMPEENKAGWLEQRRRWALENKDKMHPQGFRHSLATKVKMSLGRQGERHPNWKGGWQNWHGYVYIKLPQDNPYIGMVNANGYVLEHRLVVAQRLGRDLIEGEIVHHHNGVRNDNRFCNLALTSRSNHPHHTLLKLAQSRIRELEAQISQGNLGLGEE